MTSGTRRPLRSPYSSSVVSGSEQASRPSVENPRAETARTCSPVRRTGSVELALQDTRAARKLAGRRGRGAQGPVPLDDSYVSEQQHHALRDATVSFMNGNIFFYRPRAECEFASAIFNKVATIRRSLEESVASLNRNIDWCRT